MSEGGYRVEVASSARAVCRDAVCKKNGVKIQKGELRFCSWVSSSNDQWSGFQYKHWGCVSGKILENLRNNLRQGGPEGEYHWDYLDGLSDLSEDLQNKVKTAIIEGKIADEDFKGDPAYNQLGKKGIRGRATANKAGQAEEANVEDAGETPAKSGAKKRGRIEKEENDSVEENDFKPTKNSRAKKKIKRGDVTMDEDEKKVEADVEPPKKPRAKKSVKEDIDSISAKQEEDNESKAAIKPTRKSRVNVAVKKDGLQEKLGEESAKPSAKPETKGKARRSKKDPAKEQVGKTDEQDPIGEIKSPKAKEKEAAKESASSETEGLRVERNDEMNLNVKPTKKTRGKTAAVKESDTNKMNELEERDYEFGGNVKSSRGGHEAPSNDIPIQASPATEHEPEGNKPMDLKDRVNDGFVDKDGPLYIQFAEWIESNECSNKWPEFLRKMREILVAAKEIDASDDDGFLDRMVELEKSGMPLHDGLPRKSGKAKKARTRRGKT